MVRRSGTLAAAAAVVLLATACTAQAPETAETVASPSVDALEQQADAAENFTPLVARVLAAPVAAASTDGRTHLAYELLLSNVLSQPVGLESVTVTGDGEELLSLGPDELPEWSKVYGATEPTLTLGPGQQALVWLDVAVDSPDDVLAQLSHVVEIAPSEAVPPVIETSMSETVATVTPITDEPVVISAPLRGENWVDGNSCCVVTPHRAAVNPINGALHVPERFAIDFVQLDDGGRIFDGPIDDLSSYAYYGSEIHAVADGPIVAMRWDLEEQTPGANPIGLTVDQYGGNHIVQDIGDGRYAFYAHLQSDNPLDVQLGQQLEAGDVIALLGNTGNTSAPHLHFHVMDSPLPLASNGLPFLIDSFDLVGQISSADELDTCADTSVPCELVSTESGQREMLSPLFLDVMTFAGS